MSIPRVKLNDGTSIPVVGFGTGSAFYQKECREAVAGALETGFDSLDLAQSYGNSEYVGQAIKEWGGKREDLYILTKFVKRNGTVDPRGSLQDELEKLGVDHVDMFLIHNPNAIADVSYADVWKTMEDLKKEGLTKSIGVSNFMQEHLEQLEKVWTVPPAVNQIRYNPALALTPAVAKAKEISDKHHIHLQAYGPLGSLKAPGGNEDAVVERIAKEKGATPAQVLLAWAAQYGGGTVVTTSRDAERRGQMLEAFTKMSPLSEKEIQEIAKAAKKD
ncbi:NADP-dependent oxidoreductase domain-containing protein [Kockovaella imperatae]|uniref:NADP-dependent oxidoreductase domain-containing protein n=1 Tax=Kockovaella imperatae TaxID=4999 RepID=A0A1Y1UE87_9TREE|nr:NADP-dependent oxidoreductase domain-containing protein [Kockovaella imperatae]ORX36342.1 NADP-dependent oxidoreductase domain-containing protein [Kockovaella imperatae]